MPEPESSATHLTFDHHRAARIGLEEVVLAEPKPLPLLSALLETARQEGRRLLCTRLTAAQHAGLPAPIRDTLDYCPIARVAWLGAPAERVADADVVIVTAGTSDAGPATEALRVLEWSGVKAELIADVGVAGLWRLLRKVERLQRADVVIVCAGMDAALPSVVAGLVGGVVIAVPTSTGYGVAAGGTTALHAALASCAPGVTVVNIDNGYGAACGALRVLARLRNRQEAAR